MDSPTDKAKSNGMLASEDSYVVPRVHVRTPLAWSNKPVLPTAPVAATTTVLPALRRQTGRSLGGRVAGGG